jgi:nicotinamide-nucleotide amidase
MKIELITIGSELLAGQTLNTNALYVGERLGLAGLTLARQIAIPDDEEVIVATVRESMARVPWVLVSGGLGSTNDDVTKKAIARVFGTTLVFHDEILAELKTRYARAGRPVTPYLETQALLPDRAEIIPNPVGTAVGFYLSDGRATVAVVPGVPREMRPMIADFIVPRIAAAAGVRSRTIVWSTTAVPESRLYETLDPLMQAHPEIEVGFLPSEYGVRLKFTASGPDAATVLERWSGIVRPLLGRSVYAEADIGLPVVLGEMLKRRGMTIALAESCTGGLAAKRMTDVPGSSAYVMAGFVTYANEAKTALLGVDSRLIVAHGAVSEEVATAMAQGALVKGGADCAVAITGIAGPDGGTPEKPVGTVWIAAAIKGQSVRSECLRLLGDRAMIRERASQAALNLLRLYLEDLGK